MIPRLLSIALALALPLGLGLAMTTPGPAVAQVLGGADRGFWDADGEDLAFAPLVPGARGGGRRAVMIRDFYAFQGRDIRAERRALRQSVRPGCQDQARANGLRGPMNREARRAFVRSCVRSRVG